MSSTAAMSLKVIVVGHMVLSAWGGLASGFMPTSYLYVQGFVLACGMWAIICPDSIDSVFMFTFVNLVSIIMDIIFLGCYTEIGKDFAHAAAETGHGSMIHTYRFSLGMAITNLILKPFSSFVLYRIYQDRGGQYSDFGIPGVPGFGGSSGRGGPYENIDQPVPSNNVESASPHSTIESPQRP